MKEANLMHAKRIIEELQKVLGDLPNPEVTHYSMDEYSTINRVHERITLRIGKDLELDFWIKRDNVKESA